MTRFPHGRALAVAGMCAVLTACDPARYAHFAVAPRPLRAPDSTGTEAFALVARVATRHGLAAIAVEVASRRNEEGWLQCFTQATLFVCGKRHGLEAQFEMRQSLTSRFSPSAERLRRELLDSLRASFGASAVRECRWRLERERGRSGCPPLAPRDSM